MRRVFTECSRVPSSVSIDPNDSNRFRIDSNRFETIRGSNTPLAILCGVLRTFCHSARAAPLERGDQALSISFFTCQNPICINQTWGSFSPAFTNQHFFMDALPALWIDQRLVEFTFRQRGGLCGPAGVRPCGGAMAPAPVRIFRHRDEWRPQEAWLHRRGAYRIKSTRSRGNELAAA